MNTLKLLAALLLTAAVADAIPHFNIKVNGKDAVEGPIKVAKGEVKNGDIVARGSVTVEGVVNGDCVSMDGSVSIPGSVNGDVASLGSAVTITGTVSGDVAALGGPVTVEGRVHGDVAAMGGDVTLGPKAEINGSVALLGGKLRKAEGAKLNGSVTQLDLGMGKDMLRMAATDPEVREKWRYAKAVAGLAFLAGCALLVILTGAFAPKQVETVAAAIESDFWNSAGIGLLACIAAGPALLLVAVSVIGLPLIPVALLGIFLAKLLAIAAFSLVAGRRLRQSMAKPAPAVLGGVALGLLVLMSPALLSKLMGLVGLPGFIGGVLFLTNLVLFSFALIVGVGAIWTTRFGTKGS